jgi:AcrR family transcriptional regulator
VSQSPSPSTTSPRLGLRERKKVKLRRSAQREALRLFAEQGYEATTVEEIADAADISTSTFYRYFPTQEDVVLDDEYDPIVEQIIRLVDIGLAADGPNGRSDGIRPSSRRPGRAGIEPAPPLLRLQTGDAG